MKRSAFNLVIVGSTLSLGLSTAHAQFTGLGDAYDYAVLTDDSQNTTIQGSVIGNVGIGSGGMLNDNGSISGSVSFVDGTYSGQQNQHPSGGVQYNVSEVNTILSDISALSSTYTGGAALTFSGSATINASSGTLEDSSTYGNAYVFNLSSTAALNQGTLTICGSSAQRVVINVDGNGEFNGNITLSGGLTAEDVIINIVGGEFQNSSGDVQNVTLVGENIGGNGIDIAGTVDGPVYIGGSSTFHIDGTVNCPTPVPEPATWMAGALTLIPIAGSLVRTICRRSRQTAV